MGREDWVRGVMPGNRLRLIIIECWVLSCTGNLWNIGDVVGLVPDHCNKVNIVIKVSHLNFWFPNAYTSYLYTLLWSRLSQWLSDERLPAMQETRRCGFNPWIWKIPWMRKWQPTPWFLHGESHAQRSLVHYSPWGHKEWDTTEATKPFCSLHVQ